MTKKFLLRDLDSMDDMLDQHFSDDRMIRAIATRSNSDWYEKNNARNKDPEYRAKHKDACAEQVKKLNTDPDILKKRSEATSEFWNSDQGKTVRSSQQKKNWEKHRESMQQGLKDRYNDGTLGKKISDALKNSDKCKQNALSNRKLLQTPDGVFDSRKAAAAYYGIDPTGINRRIKKSPDQYYYLDSK